jgi:amino-acid N-acetyltransferase
VQEAELYLKKKPKDLSPEMETKLTHAIRAGKEHIQRVHIIDGREQEGLLGEVFSNEGIGTLIYANEYTAIRPALKKDARAVYALIQQGIATDELVKRTRTDVDRQISDFYVFELDKNPVGCVAVIPYPDQKKAELACLFVDERYTNSGIGNKLIGFAEQKAKEKGFAHLFCLSTQAVNYFLGRGGFSLGKPEDLPPNRREAYDKSGRKSQVLIKALM